MENYKLVMPENLNQFGYLFGGDLLKWVDEYAWIAATLNYPGCHFVTVAMDKVEFKGSVKHGTILTFVVDKTREGTTSVQYKVIVYSSDTARTKKNEIFSTRVTFVNLDEKGIKKTIKE